MALNDGRAERILQTFVDVCNINPMESFTLRIAYCNPIGDTFNDAFVTTQEKLSCCRSHPVQSAKAYFFNEVWDLDGRWRTDHQIEVLESYLKEFDSHQSSLNKVLRRATTDLRKCDILKVLDAHLFGPLSDGKCYIAKQIIQADDTECSCGCGKNIERGSTGLGSECTWHGFVDMMVKDMPIEIIDFGGTDLEKEDIELSVEEKQHTDAHQLHVKQKSFTSKLIAKTITNSFAQNNMNKNIQTFPIPAFGCDGEVIWVHSYDCKNDILLKRMNYLRFTSEEDIVILWLYLNYPLCMRKDVTDLSLHPDLNYYKANFMHFEGVPEYYTKVRFGVHGFKCASSCTPSIKYLPLIEKSKHESSAGTR